MRWIVASYTLVFAGPLIPAGTLGDRFARKREIRVGGIRALRRWRRRTSAGSLRRKKIPA